MAAAPAARPERGRRPHPRRLPLAQRQHPGDRRPAPAPLRSRPLRDPHQRALSRRLRGDRRPRAARARRRRHARRSPKAWPTSAATRRSSSASRSGAWPCRPRSGPSSRRTTSRARPSSPSSPTAATAPARPRHPGRARPGGADRDALRPEADQERATMNAVTAWLDDRRAGTLRPGERHDRQRPPHPPRQRRRPARRRLRRLPGQPGGDRRRGRRRRSAPATG